MAQTRLYEDFQPPHAWDPDERSDTLIIPLEGFSRSQLKVQVTSTRKIRVTGERQIEGNKWRRFYVEFPVPQGSDTNDIGAKFDRGTLFVRFPKLIAPAAMPPQLPPPLTQQAPPPQPPPPPPKTTTREEPKSEEAMEKKPETKKDETKMEQKEKEPPKEYKKKEDISEGKKEEEAKAKRPETTEGLSSMQGDDYKDAIVGFVGELKKQKNVINMLVVVFVVLLLGLYLKHLVVSYFGGSSKSHQEL